MHTGSQIPDGIRLDGGAGDSGAGDPVRVSGTCQEWRGARFYRCGRYFQRKGSRLHRVVWAAAFGPIPPGHHIHHRDGDPANNVISNLECLSAADHLGARHGEASAKRGRRSIVRAAAAAKAWHGSVEGLAWHRQHYDKNCAPALANAKRDFVCEQCGDAFRAISGRFCSGRCKAAWRRASGVDDEDRRCVVCGSGFRANRYSKTAACSRECGAVVSARVRTGVPQRKRCGNR